ncbi:unnamed protein product [Alternaria alternata]
MAPANPPTSLVNSIKTIEALKVLIIDQVRAIHGHSFPTKHYTFSVLTSALPPTLPPPGSSIRKPIVFYTAQAIVYTKPDSFAEWKLLAESELGDSTWEAVENLYCKLQEQVGEVMQNLVLRQMWNGKEAIDDLMSDI